MKVLLSKPNLPEGRVTKVLLGEEYLNRLERPLQDLGIAVIPLPADPDLAEPVRSHADMSVLHLGGRRFIAAKKAGKELCSAGIFAMDAQSPRAKSYPLDVGLNVCIIGENAFLNIDYADGRAVEELKALNYKIHHVSQGYAKCSVCVVSETHVITQDSGIYLAALGTGLEALKIRHGGIALPGYDSGFLGGCCGKTGPDRLAFTGRLSAHPDCAAILDFLKRASVEPVYLSDEPVFDVGGIIPVFEEKNA